MPRNIGESRRSCFCDNPEKQDGRLGIPFHFRGLGVGNELESGVRARNRRGKRPGEEEKKGTYYGIGIGLPHHFVLFSK